MFEFRSKSALRKASAASAALIFACFVSVERLPAQTAAPTSETLKNTMTSPERLSASFAEVARIVEPAVVNIDTKGKVTETAARSGATAESGDDILDFLRQMPRRPSSSVGSGFIVDKSGYILTNAHVVEDSSRITVRLDSGEEYVAKVVGTDEETDVAVLKIETGRDLPFVKLGNSERARVGDWVLAIGSPFGLSRTVTAGIVSQTKRETPGGSAFQKFIQTDAAINKGNSGGPLVNMDGEVIGINSQIATSTGDYNGIGFALPANEAANVYRQIVQNGKVRRGYLGVILDSVKAEYAKVYGLKDTGGAIVTDVRDPLSAAAKAGLQVGDVVVEFNGQKIQSAQDLIGKVAATKPDESVSMVFWREAGTGLERKTTMIRLAERPSNNTTASTDDETRRKLPVGGAVKPEEVKPFGLTLTELTPALAASSRLEGQKGLLVKDINPASFIADVKSSTGGDALDEGDLIQRINRVTVTDMKTFNEVARKLKIGDAVVLHVLSSVRAGRLPQLKIVQFTVQ
jgi:serine protease Do